VLAPIQDAQPQPFGELVHERAEFRSILHCPQEDIGGQLGRLILYGPCHFALGMLPSLGSRAPFIQCLGCHCCDSFRSIFPDCCQQQPFNDWHAASVGPR
jgi:hypothetical protein